MKGVRIRSAKDVASFDVDTRIYALDAILGTARTFVERCFVFLDQPQPHHVRVTLSGKSPLGRDELRALCGDFLNELLGRVPVAHAGPAGRRAADPPALPVPSPADEPTAAVAAVVAPVPSPADEAAAGLPDANADYLEDPLGIAVPWEEQYGQYRKP